MKTGLFIGRFQPFHKGHLDAMKQALTHVDYLKIVIGSSNKKRSKDNPLSYGERKKYMQSVLPFTCCTIYPVPDVPSDRQWIKNVKRTVGHFDIAFLSSNDWVEGIFKEHRIPYTKLRFNVPISATKIRTMISTGDKKFTKSLVHTPFPQRLQRIIQQSQL